jgi:hypothetical protein
MGHIQVDPGSILHHFLDSSGRAAHQSFHDSFKPSLFSGILHSKLYPWGCRFLCSPWNVPQFPRAKSADGYSRVGRRHHFLGCPNLHLHVRETGHERLPSWCPCGRGADSLARVFVLSSGLRHKFDEEHVE